MEEVIEQTEETPSGKLFSGNPNSTWKKKLCQQKKNTKPN